MIDSFVNFVPLCETKDHLRNDVLQQRTTALLIYWHF
jgi:hypothetical protein